MHFQSRNDGNLVLMPSGRGLRFKQGNYSTNDPEEVAILRDICRSEQRSNNGVWEVNSAGERVLQPGVATPPDVRLGAVPASTATATPTGKGKSGKTAKTARTPTPRRVPALVRG